MSGFTDRVYNAKLRWCSKFSVSTIGKTQTANRLLFLCKKLFSDKERIKEKESEVDVMNKKLIEREQRCNHLKAERESVVSAYFGGGLLMISFLIMLFIWIMMG